jgi:hypothetical protein
MKPTTKLEALNYQLRQINTCDDEQTISQVSILGFLVACLTQGTERKPKHWNGSLLNTGRGI